MQNACKYEKWRSSALESFQAAFFQTAALPFISRVLGKIQIYKMYISACPQSDNVFPTFYNNPVGHKKTGYRGACIRFHLR